MIGKKIWMPLLLCMSIATISASASSLEWSYEAEQRKLSVNGNATQNEFLSMALLPYDGVISEQTVNEGIVLLKTAESKDGKITADIVIPENWNCGRYEISVEDKKYFLLIPKEGFGDSLSGVTTDEDIYSLLTEANGFSNGADNAQKKKIAEIMSGYVPENGYDTDTFVKHYMVVEGLILFQEDSISVSDFFERYAVYLGEEVAEEEQENYADILAFYQGSPEKIMTEGKLLLNLRYGNKSEFEDEMLAYIDAENLSLGKYESLNNYYENEFWDSLYEEREAYTSFEQVYEKFISEADSQYSSQTGKDKNYSSSGGGGGGGSGKGLAGVSASINRENTSAEENGNFSDMVGHWAEEKVKELAKNGIVSGMGDGTFQPDRKVTRAEFTKMLVKMMGLAEEATDAFVDVDKDAWFSGAVGAAYKAGIVKGDEGKFRPNDLISRQDAAVMLNRFLEYGGLKLTGSANFTDSDYIADYATHSVQVLAANGVITGYEQSFRPQDSTSRAEAAVMICRAADIRKG